MYSRQELKGKKVINISVGSKDKGLYSTEAALSDLQSFAESAKMTCILDRKFHNCLDFTDILNQEDEINKLISDIKEVINT